MASLHPGPGLEVAIWMCPLPHPNICTLSHPVTSPASDPDSPSSCHCFPPAASPVPSSPLFLNRHDSSFPTTELPNSFPRIQPKVLPVPSLVLHLIWVAVARFLVLLIKQTGSSLRAFRSLIASLTLNHFPKNFPQSATFPSLVSPNT